MRKKSWIEDWRVQFQSNLAKDTIDVKRNVHLKKGSHIYISCECTWQENTYVSIPMPSPVAMYLNLAYGLYKKSLELKKKINIGAGENNLINQFETVTDYLESYIGSLIFSTTAIEAYCNVMIPSGTTYKSGSKILRKEEIERKINLENKLTKVLPGIYNVKVDKEDQVWRDFKILISLRNRLIHLKDADRLSCDRNDNTLWNHLMTKDLIDPYSTVKSLILEYYTESNKDSNPKPNWLINSPSN